MAQYMGDEGPLEKGLIWKVGTGTNISIRNDIWIPDFRSLRLSSINVDLRVDSVAELINNNENNWNRDLIVNTFPKEVAELILRIPLAMEPHSDLLAWTGEPSGEYTVQSAYKLLQSGDPRAYAEQNVYRDFYKKLCAEFSVVCFGPFGETETLGYMKTQTDQTVKINFDGAFDERNQQSVSGIVVRDSKGLVLISCSELYRGVVSPFAVEALACRRATQIGLEMQRLASHYRR
ncbi:hypothetical protein CXB51_009143 [Gossypium anomalum]|uniref:RNase H type-1 domain-containing protein n=1 Tax=Gossypium anomalum TaxID=47600 RepID=A0A8J5ZDR5_9ROSI|nr:hypothetical protein CXB51_009143 [Gossypium anomalum]